MDNNSARIIHITKFLHLHFFDGLRSPNNTGKLTFNKGCRFSNVILIQQGVKTEGYLWRLEDEISTISYGGRRRQYQRRQRPLKWLADRLAYTHPLLSIRLSDILNLDEPATPSQEWQMSIIDIIEEAIEQEKKLYTATLLGPGRLSVAIFVMEPGHSDTESDETGVSSEIGSERSLEYEQDFPPISLGAQADDAEPLVLDEGYAFTSIDRNQQGQQGFK
jgi:hypothetical protein